MNALLNCVGLFLIALAVIYGLKGAMKTSHNKEDS